jgi:ATP-dependent Clp protease, protease subunit
MAERMPWSARGSEDWPWLPPPEGPGGPGRPGAPSVVGDGAASLADVMARRLLEQRVVLLSGTLDELTATRVSAELMTLDADGDDPVTLRVDCGDAALAPALTLMDVVELMGVPVHALCLGQVSGGAVGVVAVCEHRAALPSTRISLCEPTTHLEAHVRNVAQRVELHAAERRRFCERIGEAAGKAAETVEADFDRGRFLSAEEAVAYGILDEVSRPDAAIRPLRGGGESQPPMGFRPLR